jgi:hypothetical protein
MAHKEAWKTGGFVSVFDLATASGYVYNSPKLKTSDESHQETQVLGIGAYRVWQILE